MVSDEELFTKLCFLIFVLQYSISLPHVPTIDTMNRSEFDTMMQKGYNEAIQGAGVPVDEAFRQIREGI